MHYTKVCFTAHLKARADLCNSNPGQRYVSSLEALMCGIASFVCAPSDRFGDRANCRPQIMSTNMMPKPGKRKFVDQFPF